MRLRIVALGQRMPSWVTVAVADYAKRKGLPLEQAERWLAPNLDYDPD